MRTTLRLFVLLLAAALTLPAFSASNPDGTTPLAPFRIAGSLYYVGSRDLASYLITTTDGNILINSKLGKFGSADSP